MNDRTNEVTLPDGCTIEDLMRLGKLHPDAYIVTKSSRPVPLTSKLQDGERLKLVKVASGGFELVQYGNAQIELCRKKNASICI